MSKWINSDVSSFASAVHDRSYLCSRRTLSPPPPPAPSVVVPHRRLLSVFCTLNFGSPVVAVPTNTRAEIRIIWTFDTFIWYYNFNYSKTRNRTNQRRPALADCLNILISKSNINATRKLRTATAGLLAAAHARSAEVLVYESVQLPRQIHTRMWSVIEINDRSDRTGACWIWPRCICYRQRA